MIVFYFFLFPDISDIRYVVNFDFPTDIEDYVHRIGRTARGDREGTAYALFSSSETPAVARDLMRVLRESNHEVPRELEEHAGTFSGRESSEEYESFYQVTTRLL